MLHFYMVLYSLGLECMHFHMVLYSLGPEWIHFYMVLYSLRLECINFYMVLYSLALECIYFYMVLYSLGSLSPGDSCQALGGNLLVENCDLDPEAFVEAFQRKTIQDFLNSSLLSCKSGRKPQERIQVWFLRAFGQLPKKRNWGQYRFFESIQTTSENHAKMSTQKKRAKRHESDNELLPASYWRCMKHA